MTWSVELPDCPVHTHNGRGHWNRKYEAFMQWRVNTGWAAKSVRVPFPDPPVVVTLHCVQSDRRRRDADNIVAGAVKPTIDGLVDAGLLGDDSWRFVSEVRCRLTSDPELEVHRWVLTVVAA